VLGQFLFRWRGLIGGLVYAVALGLGRPDLRSCLLGLALVMPGLAVRFWAAGCIGPGSRAAEIGAEQVVRSGPYRLFPHPLYFGNLLLVVGMLVALRPPQWASAVVLAGFLFEYLLIGRAEQRFLRERDLPVVEPGFSAGKALGEWRTWLYTGLAWLLGLAKTLFGAR
jgi:protein-S-isoprenylcysteine O-methyltransferase Ste14